MIQISCIKPVLWDFVGSLEIAGFALSLPDTCTLYSFPFELLCMHILRARNDQAPVPSFSTKPQLRWTSIIPFPNKASNYLKYPSLLLHACTHEPLASILSPTKAPLASHMSHYFLSEFSIYPMYHAASKPPKHFPFSMWRSPFN